MTPPPAATLEVAHPGAAGTPRVWLGESLRWYLRHARHPFKNYVVGHYWGWFCKPRLWVNYDEGAALKLCLGDFLQQRIFLDGYYERGIINWLKRTLRPTDVFWDVGANIGAVTIAASRLCQRVVAFEPDPRSLELLELHARVNRLDNVQIVPVALGAENARARLFQSSSANTGRTSIVDGWAEPVGSVDVQTRRADDFVLEFPDRFPTVIKLDVEGAEHLVLAGARQLLRDGRVRGIVFEDRQSHGVPTSQPLVQALADAGYEIQAFGVSADGPEPVVEGETVNFLAIPIDQARRRRS